MLRIAGCEGENLYKPRNRLSQQLPNYLSDYKTTYLQAYKLIEIWS